MKCKTELRRYKEVYEIIQGIKSGKLNHEQSSFHCGTAHCLAGWMEVKELERRNLPIVFHLTSGDWIEPNENNPEKVNYRSYSPVTRNLDKYSDRLKHSREQMELTWLWARCRLGLTHDESELLFDQWLTIEEIEENFWDICRERYLSKEDILD